MDENTTKQILTAALGSLARHSLGALATWLVTVNLLAPSQEESFVQIGLGLLSGLLALAWSVLQKRKSIHSLSDLKSTLASAVAAQQQTTGTVPSIPPTNH